MSNAYVKLRNEGAVGLITLDRPPANSYDFKFWTEFDSILDAVEQDGAIRAVVVCSSSKKFFCAGANIDTFAANSAEENLNMIHISRRVYNRITTIPKIFIAAINGHALGGGLELALACDIRFAGNGNFLFGLPEVKLGLMPGSGGTQRLARLIGAAKALKLMLMGSTFKPQQALEYGIVHDLYPPTTLHKETITFASELAKGATLAIGHIKRAVNEGVGVDFADGMALELNLMRELLMSADSAEGFTAFIEKRPPNFKGR